jgi:PTS system nitrogen regulatory IIA component
MNGADNMRLTVRDVGRFLGVAEATVARWIKQRGLPAQYVGGQHRFNRAEVLEWATANKLRVSVEMFDNLEDEDDAPPSLADALAAGGIHYRLKSSSKDAALRALVDVLPLPEGTDRELLLRLFQAREASASTGIGDGIALPHVRNPIVLNVDRPTITLCCLEQPVDFGALDGKPVVALFSMICPTTRTHLQLLARLAYALHDPLLKAQVLGAAPAEQILSEVRRVEAALPTPTEGGREATA